MPNLLRRCSQRPKDRPRRVGVEAAARSGTRRSSARGAVSNAGVPSSARPPRVSPMRARLGDAHWFAFARHANRHHKAAYVRAERVLRCVGPVGGGSCPHAFEVDLAARDATLEHLDHEQPVHLTCAAWSEQLPDARMGRRDRRRRSVPRALRCARRGAWCALSALPVRAEECPLRTTRTATSRSVCRGVGTSDRASSPHSPSISLATERVARRRIVLASVVHVGA